MENTDFMNVYIDRLTNELVELTKHRVLIDTKLIITEKMNADLLQKNNELEKKVQQLDMRFKQEPAKVPHKRHSNEQINTPGGSEEQF